MLDIKMLTLGSYHWKIGDDWSIVVRNNLNEIEEIFATEEEHKFIYALFFNIPKVINLHSTRWFGDHAKFIVSNLIQSDGDNGEV